MKGYKVFNPDFTCNGYKFTENSEHKHEGAFKICNSGFHFCLKLSDCFSYYSFDKNNIVCEVEALGEIQTHSDDSKACTNHIKIGKVLTWEEVLFNANEGKDNTGHSNSGNSNSGYRNSGNRNSGNWNSGYRNSGNWNSGNRNSGNWNSGNSNSGNWNSGNRNSGNSNSGNWNSGDWNSGNSNSGNWNSGDWNSGNSNSGDSNSGYRNSGAFCTDTNPKAILFNKESNLLIKEWEQHPAYNVMSNYLSFTFWINSSEMTQEEKDNNPKHETCGGYLKTISHKEGWANMWGNISEENKQHFKSIPNFDSAIFEEITGIKF